MFDYDKEMERIRRKNDLQEKEVVEYCDFCGGEIYEGNEYFVDIFNQFIYDSEECAKQSLFDRHITVKEAHVETNEY